MLFMSLPCSKIFGESSSVSLVFLKDHFIILACFFPHSPFNTVLLSLLFPFSLAKLAYPLSLNPFYIEYFLYCFFLSTVYPYHHYLQPIQVLPDWAQILSLKGLFIKTHHYVYSCTGWMNYFIILA